MFCGSQGAGLAPLCLPHRWRRRPQNAGAVVCALRHHCMARVGCKWSSSDCSRAPLPCQGVCVADGSLALVLWDDVNRSISLQSPQLALLLLSPPCELVGSRAFAAFSQLFCPLERHPPELILVSLVSQAPLDREKGQYRVHPYYSPASSHSGLSLLVPVSTPAACYSGRIPTMTSELFPRLYSCDLSSGWYVLPRLYFLWNPGSL